MATSFSVTINTKKEKKWKKDNNGDSRRLSRSYDDTTEFEMPVQVIASYRNLHYCLPLFLH